jgi:TPR repeat protein
LGGNEKEAINIWKQDSEMGNLDATYALGIVFYDSDVTGLCQRIEDSDCKNNFKSGLKYYKTAHDAGDVRATYALGEHYDYFRKFKKAFRFYLTAAEAGVPEAQFNTASMYEHGEGVTQDTVQAVRWYLQCNETKLCLQKEDGISDLIEKLTIDELKLAKSFLIIDQVPINIRLDSVAKSK